MIDSHGTQLFCRGLGNANEFTVFANLALTTNHVNKLFLKRCVCRCIRCTLFDCVVVSGVQFAGFAPSHQHWRARLHRKGIKQKSYGKGIKQFFNYFFYVARACSGASLTSCLKCRQCIERQSSSSLATLWWLSHRVTNSKLNSMILTLIKDY